MKTCKECKFWLQANADGRYSNYGGCERKEISDSLNNQIENPPILAGYGEHSMDYILFHKDFGCIHSELKEGEPK